MTTSLLVRNISYHVRSGEFRFQGFGEIRRIFIFQRMSLVDSCFSYCLPVSPLLSLLVGIISQEDQKVFHL
jgi:hypothetical protein